MVCLSPWRSTAPNWKVRPPAFCHKNAALVDDLCNHAYQEEAHWLQGIPKAQGVQRCGRGTSAGRRKRRPSQQASDPRLPRKARARSSPQYCSGCKPHVLPWISIGSRSTRLCSDWNRGFPVGAWWTGSTSCIERRTASASCVPTVKALTPGLSRCGCFTNVSRQTGPGVCDRAAGASAREWRRV